MSNLLTIQLCVAFPKLKKDQYQKIFSIFKISSFLPTNCYYLKKKLIDFELYLYEAVLFKAINTV